MSLPDFLKTLFEPATRFHSTQNFHWIFILTTLALAVAVYVWQARETSSSRSSSPPLSFIGFFRWCFPKRIFWHPSARLDYGYCLLNSILFAVMFGGSLSLVYPEASAAAIRLLTALFGPPDTSAGAAGRGWLLTAFATVILLLATDFAIYLMHWCQHKIPFLWEFHKVHHSAEVLTPITVSRLHPVDLLGVMILSTALPAVFSGILFYFNGRTVSPYEYLGMNIFLFAFTALGRNLRHSHIWLSWGPVLEHVFISPAQHQVHHSCLPRHMDRNMGTMLAVWDWMFGTLYVPEGREELRLGLTQRDRNEGLTSIATLYVRPFTNNFKKRKTAVILLGGGMIWLLLKNFQLV